MKILIVGAGIGGLSAALCGLHFGHDVTVFEQAPALSDIGAGIQIPPNAMKVFEALGMTQDITDAAFTPDAIEARMGVSGRNIFTIPLAKQAVDRWGSPYLHIHRADYVKALSAALQRAAPKSLQLGAKVAGYTQDSGGVTLELQDGRKAFGDILIGADGIKSSIRALMMAKSATFVNTPAQYTGNIAWRAVVPMAALGKYAPNPTACVWMGAGRHGVTYRLRGGKLANFVGVVERPDLVEHFEDNDTPPGSWSEKGSRDDMLTDFEGWHPVITEFIKAANPDALYRWALFDRAPLARWTDGRAALLGDAAHPMLPFLAQGAAMAVEDSWVLAQQISQDGQSVQGALGAYQSLRHKRTSRAQAGSRANMKTFHQSTVLGKVNTYGPMWLAGNIAPSLVHKRMDWLYGFDVTQAAHIEGAG